MNKILKIFFICFSIVLLLVGCGKKGEEQVAFHKISNQERPPIIDMHMHPHRIRITTDGKPLSVPRTYNNPPRIDESTTAMSVEETLQATLVVMDKHNVVKGFLSGNPDYVYQWVAGAPNRFIASPSISGKASDPSIDFLRDEYSSGRLEAMGEIWSQLFGLSPTDPALEPYFALAEELDLPVLIHTAGLGPRLPDFRSSLGNPLLLEEVLVKHPKLRIWVENAGYPFLQEMIILMYQYPQVYVDLSTVTWIIPREAFHDYLRGLIIAGLGKRLMFGSDQMNWPEAIELAIEGIESADFLTEEQKRDIFYNNAVRFLKLEE